MKKVHFLILILIVCKLSSCKKDIVEEVDINYTFLDDVSPVIVKFKVNKDIYYAKWIINDSIELSFGGKNEMEYIFTTPGISRVNFIASTQQGEKLTGQINLVIPDVANKLKIKGIYIEDANKVDFKQDTIDVRFSYYDSKLYKYFSSKINTAEFKTNDTLIFKNPIEIDIDNLSDKTVLTDKWIYVELIYFNGDQINYLFRSLTYLKTEYFIERNIDSFFYSENIQLYGFHGGDTMKIVKLIADWSR
jgi:hypothetical protein